MFSLSFSILHLHSSAVLWHPRLGPVAGILANKTVQYLAHTLLRVLQLRTYSSIHTNNHPAITNTNRFNKVRWAARPLKICATCPWLINMTSPCGGHKVLFCVPENFNLTRWRDLYVSWFQGQMSHVCSHVLEERTKLKMIHKTQLSCVTFPIFQKCLLVTVMCSVCWTVDNMGI